MFHDEACAGDVVGPGAPYRLTSDQLAPGLEAFGHDLVGSLAVEHALAAVVVGGVQAAQELFEVAVRMEGDLKHLRADPAIEALDHAIRLRRAGPGVAVLGAELGAVPGEGGRKAAAVVGQHMGELERKRRRSFPEKGDGALLGLGVLDGEVHRTGPAVDGDEQVALAPLAIGGLQLGRSSPRFLPRSGWNGCGGV